MTNPIILAGYGLSKQFAGNTVLDGVTIECRRQNVLALVGENGAGKSTLMNILSGGLAADEGRIELQGREVVFANPLEAKRSGVAFVHQELSLMQNMTVGENIMLGQEPRAGRLLVSQKRLHEQAAQILNDIGYHVPVEAIVADLTPAQKQMTEIAKAWADKPQVLILDEPTSSLNKTESDQLFSFVRQIRDKGVSVILITHRLEEIALACDDVIVLKDGVIVTRERVDHITRDEIICKMVGARDYQYLPCALRRSFTGADVGTERRFAARHVAPYRFNGTKGQCNRCGRAGRAGAVCICTRIIWHSSLYLRRCTFSG